MKTRFKTMKVRVPEQMDELIRESVTREGFQSLNAWMVNAFSNQLRYTPDAIHDFEARIVDEFERRRDEQVWLTAMLDSFVRLFLICVPDPDPALMQERESAAFRRHRRFVDRTAKTIQAGGVKLMAEGQASGQ